MPHFIQNIEKTCFPNSLRCRVIIWIAPIPIRDVSTKKGLEGIDLPRKCAGGLGWGFVCNL